MRRGTGENPATARIREATCRTTDDYRDSDNLVARLTLPNMAYPPERRVEVYAQAVRGLTALEPDPEKRLKYLDFSDIYAALDDNERAQYLQDYPDEAQTMSRFAERFREGQTARHAARHAGGHAAGYAAGRGARP